MAISFKVEDHFEPDEIMEALSEIAHPLELACWGTCNYFNFGSLIRTSHNFALRRMWGVDLWEDPEDKRAKPFYKKAAMTTLKWTKQNIHCVSMDEFIEQTQGRNIVAFERRERLETIDIRNFAYPEEPILLFGSEKSGVPERLLERADHVVSIPVYGFCLDFNLAQAASIAIYDWLLKHSLKQKFQEK